MVQSTWTLEPCGEQEKEKECSRAKEKDSATKVKECSKECQKEKVKEKAKEKERKEKGMVAAYNKEKGKGNGYFICGSNDHWSKECPKEKEECQL